MFPSADRLALLGGFGRLHLRKWQEHSEVRLGPPSTRALVSTTAHLIIEGIWKKHEKTRQTIGTSKENTGTY